MTATDQASNNQLKALLKAGVPLADACESLNLDEEAARLFLETDNNKVVTVDELIQKFRPKCIEILYNIACDDTLENTGARVSAAKVIVDGKGEVPEFSVDKLSEMYKQMRSIVDKAAETITAPSPSTTIVSVNVENQKSQHKLKMNKLDMEEKSNANTNNKNN